MVKISTLYKKDPNDLSRVINELNPENKWVIDGEGIPTRKFDGITTAIIDGEIYIRYNVKIGEQVPLNAIPCQDPDEITGLWEHWEKCERNDNASKYHLEALNSLVIENGMILMEGTYELCGEEIHENPELIEGHSLIKHGIEVLPITDFSFEGLKEYLSNPELDIEGIVFHHKTDGRMCKIRKCDFGVKRQS